MSAVSVDDLASLMPRWNKYMPLIPTAKQFAFLSLDSREALYGGAAGGGKSICLILGGAQYVDVPGYAALLLRRTYADLEKPGALIPVSQELFGPTDAHWDGVQRKWRFPSGAVLDFGYLDNDLDVFKYQSSAYHFIGFDELTQFEEPWYRYLFSRQRRTKTRAFIPTRTRGATNPGGIGHEWVRQRFLIEGPGEGRVFLPAKLEDNDYLDREDYERSLENLDPTLKAQLRWGDWSVRPPGSFFKRLWFKLKEQAPAGAKPIRMWDLAATKNQTSAYTAGALISINAGRLCVHDMRRIRGDPGEVEDLVRQTAQMDGRGVQVHMEQEPGSGGVNTMYRYRHSVLQGYSFHPYLPKHDKLTRAAPLSALARGGGVDVVVGYGAYGGQANWVISFLDEFDSFPNGFKDQVDTVSAGLQVLTQKAEWGIRSL
jgi:phage terminase large subunit-like protein